MDAAAGPCCGRMADCRCPAGVFESGRMGDRAACDDPHGGQSTSTLRDEQKNVKQGTLNDEGGVCQRRCESVVNPPV